MTLDRATVLAALRAEDVTQHFAIPGQWRGRWLRSSRCALGDHDTEAFGIARDGHWHCWACDKGGDLLRLVAVGEKLDMRADFPRILEIAAAIAGVDDEESFGASPKPPAKARDPLPPVPPLAQRVALAKKRAAWVWSRLFKWDDMARTTEWGQPGRKSVADSYLALERGLDPVVLRKLEELRETPMRITPQESCKSADLKTLSFMFATPGVALPVRHILDGELVDVRVRRFEPRDGQPKIIGMLGGVTAGPAEGGRPRQLVGCYGNPHCIDPGPSRMVVVCEGAMDYLTGLCVWPDAQVLGAVDAGTLNLVAAHAARGLADYPGGKLLIVEQNDGAGAAADRSVNEDVNAATKVAVRILGPKRVGWLFCKDGEVKLKDLNDLFRRRGADITRAMAKWWVELP
jgi:hypothetical protein